MTAMIRKKSVTRRRFLKAAGVAAGGPFLAGLPSVASGGILGANEFLRLGWIGVGDRGSALLRHALDCVSSATLKVTGICDIDPAARERAIGKCGAMKPSGVADYKELLERSDVDVVFIATPIHLHAEHATAALKAGKHVYCEKPLGSTPRDVKAVYDAVKASQKRFQVGFQWRYHQGFLALVEAVQGGKAGKPCFVAAQRHVSAYPTSGWYVDRNLSGDLIVEQAVHEMNVFCWMLKSHPLRAAGIGGINALKDVPPGRTIMDHYAVTFEFPEAITVAYSHCIYTPQGFGGLYQAVYGTGGRGVILEDTTRLSVSQDGKRVPVEMPPMRDATELAILSFVKCIREDQEPLANVEAGRNATLMAILGRTAIHERRVAEWSDVAI
jgi:myo-inositol 2-dehydrogenase / D-chiro-inositol 1-dehydrogenase